MYQHGKRTVRPKDKKVYVRVAIVIGIALIIAAWILQKDLRMTTSGGASVPIITEVAEDKDDVIKVDEALFSLELPADWKLTRRVQESYANYYEWHSTKKGGDDRRLLLHIDIMPQAYKLVRLQPLTPNGASFVVGNLSVECINFATAAGTEQRASGTAPVEAKWENVTFMCDPINANQTIGTGTVDGGIAAKLGGHNYFFYWEDHNIRPDNRMLQQIISSFKVK